MKKIVFIADFFLEDGISGGAEQYNHNLIDMLSSEYDFEKIKSINTTLEIIRDRKDMFFIISNFMGLSEKCKKEISKYKYLILEHDHKYVSTNDPSKFIDMLAPQEQIINKQFFENSIAILCQSKVHAEVLQKNLLVDNVINLSCNLWSDKQLSLLEEKQKIAKTIEYSILDSQNKNKGSLAAIKYCNDNGIVPNKIGQMQYEDFLSVIAKTKNLIFFPQWLESFNRLTVEAKILGCNIITNKLIGVASEAWFRNGKKESLVQTLRKKREEVLSIFKVLLDEEKHDFFIEPIKVPKISIITSLYNGDEFIDRFMRNITSQTVFEKCELIILDANSPGNEYQTIKEYEKKYKNIIYHRLEKRLSVQETMNLGIKKATGTFLTLANVDDLRKDNHIEFLSKALSVDSSIDLVYSDCYETDNLCDSADEIQEGKLYEHSRYIFSKSNMIKCLPGPMPVWRANMHEKCGFFDEKYKYAGDWDLWLRAVKTGSRFKKIQKVLGIYYNNPNGLSTSAKNLVDKFKEEKEIFNKNKDVFGERNVKMFEGYFNER